MVKKANTAKYRLVHDLRAINEITEMMPPVVANPHSTLNQVTPMVLSDRLVKRLDATFVVIWRYSLSQGRRNTKTIKKQLVLL